MNKHQKLWALTSIAAALGLAGCWDGDDGDPAPAPTPPTSTEVPDSAGVSTAAFFSYLLSLSGTDESSEPLGLKDSFAVPADEVSEPTPLP
jgi:hypothetical protein